MTSMRTAMYLAGPVLQCEQGAVFGESQLHGIMIRSQLGLRSEKP